MKGDQPARGARSQRPHTARDAGRATAARPTVPSVPPGPTGPTGPARPANANGHAPVESGDLGWPWPAAVVPPPSGGASVSIGDFFGVLRRRIITLLVCLALCLGAAFGLLSSATKQYDAVSTVKVAPVKGDSDTAGGINTITEARIVTSTAVAQRAARTLHFDGLLDDLLARVTVSSPLGSLLIYVTYSSDRPHAAARGANAFANAYLDYRKSVGETNLNRQAAAISAKIQTLQQELDTLPKTAPSGKASALQSQIDRLNSSLYDVNTTIVVPGQVVGVAQPPASPSSPKKIIYVLGGLLIGLVVGTVAAVVRDRRDDKLHGRSDLENSINAPVLAAISARTRIEDVAVVPSGDAPKTARTGDELDAYRTVATKLRTPTTGRGSHTFLLARGGEVKEEHAPLNLAATFARQGIQTALVTTDRGLRHLSALFGDELIPTSVDDGLTAVPSVPNLWLLALGPEDDVDATIAREQSEIEISLNLVEVALLDGVNLDRASSVLALGQLTHAAVMIAIDRRTTHAELGSAIRELGQIGTGALGGVLYQRRRRRQRLKARKQVVEPVGEETDEQPD